jgi:hypothetical protein
MLEGEDANETKLPLALALTLAVALAFDMEDGVRVWA